MKFKPLTLALLTAVSATVVNAAKQHDDLIANPPQAYKESPAFTKTAELSLGYLVTLKTNDPERSADFLSRLQTKAKSDAATKYFLGQLIRGGKIAGKTEKQGVELIKQAAKAGVAEANNDLGVIYLQGFSGVKKDSKQALTYFTNAASKGMGSSYHIICMYYEKGLAPIKKDTQKAMQCYKNSADKYNLGEGYAKYASLKSVDKNLDQAGELEAIQYAIKAGEHGSAAAFTLAGGMLVAPKFNEPNLPLGFKNIQLSAELGFKPAYKILAQMYAEGAGTKADAAIAKVWFDRANEK